MLTTMIHLQSHKSKKAVVQTPMLAQVAHITVAALQLQGHMVFLQLEQMDPIHTMQIMLSDWLQVSLPQIHLFIQLPIAKTLQLPQSS